MARVGLQRHRKKKYMFIKRNQMHPPDKVKKKCQKRAVLRIRLQIFIENSRHVEVNCPYHGSPREKGQKKRKKERKKGKKIKCLGSKTELHLSIYAILLRCIYIYICVCVCVCVCVWIVDKANIKTVSLLFCFIQVRVSLIKISKTSEQPTRCVGNLQSIRYQTQNYSSPFQLLRQSTLSIL